ncbi:MAG: hypothetical protein ACYCOU_19305 [Sulfobacillus sp.]
MDFNESLRQALKEWHNAESAFLQSDPEYCDYHIYQLHAAEEKVRLVLRQARAVWGIATDIQPSLPFHWRRALGESQMGDAGTV